MADVARATRGATLPDGVEASLDSDATFDPVNFNYPHGTHLCAMEVDTETGQVKMRKYAACDDIGNIINPLIVSGQVHGGLVQGIAQALWEEAVYDDSGTLVSGSFVDYLLPTAPTRSASTSTTRPRRRRPTRRHQGRQRGGHDRLDAGRRERGRRRRTHLGINDIRMPCTPERVWKAINDARGGAMAETEGAAAPHFDAVTGMEGTVDRTAGRQPRGGNQ